MEFAYKLRARKPTQSSVDAAARLGFMLDIDDYWHEGVHGFMDQCEFCVPLCQRVRPQGERALARYRRTQAEVEGTSSACHDFQSLLGRHGSENTLQPCESAGTLAGAVAQRGALRARH